jgi:SAM-dependent methyltransferase
MGNPLRLRLHADLLPLLRCTICGSSLEEQEQGYRCSVCRKEFPLVRGVLRFVDTSNYAESFGYQWQKFSRTQLWPEVSERNFRRKTALREEDMRGKLVLDVGCGMGRFADVATRWGAKVIGVDLSDAGEIAATNLADREFVALQADVFALPFAPGSFDCIYSVGVLHHTPDCENAFKKLPRYLKPGGKIAVWLYSGYNNWYRFSDHYRKLTHRMPVERLHSFLSWAVPGFYWLDRGLRAIPVVGPPVAGLVHHVFPVNRHWNSEIRILDTLDWYSPQYQSKHTYEQVFRWFEACGLEHLTVADVSIGVRGQASLSKPIQELRDPPSEFRETPVPLDHRVASPNTLAPNSAGKGFSVSKKAARTMRWFPSYAWQRVTRRAPGGNTHLVIALADHFEPAIVPHDGSARAPYDEQERRLEHWSRTYPIAFDTLRDNDGRPFVHTFFYPAEQYDRGLVGRLASDCHAGWGEVEVHLHHGIKQPDSAENTRRQLMEFRDALAFEHGSLSFLDGFGPPRYGFVHGNFALANSAGGYNCGVDSEIAVLAETGCYADFTLPPGLYHRTHIAKINSLYECIPPLERPQAYRNGRDLEAGRTPTVFPLIVEGPLMLSYIRPDGRRLIGVENGSITTRNPPTPYRLSLWKRAGITVKGRPDWLFIKLQCHGMDPRDEEVMLGPAIRQFLREIIESAHQRKETLHFVTAREMVNIMLAACDGREGNPREYRDYRLKRTPAASAAAVVDAAKLVLKS